MLRNFGISLLLLGLLATAVEGFRTRDGVRPIEPVRTAEVSTGSPPPF